MRDEGKARVKRIVYNWGKYLLGGGTTKGNKGLDCRG